MEMFNKFLRAGEGKKLKVYNKMLAKINALEPELKLLSDSELQGKTKEFKDRLAQGETLDDLIIEAFALVREASSRVIFQRHYDVQILGGLALYYGNIAEMKTGEGKTLVSTLPAYLKALTGKPVHVVTVNDYLAQRDSQWMGQIHKFLGLSVGCLHPSHSTLERREVYENDILYGTNTEFGFDYLRDNMVTEGEEKVARGYYYAIIDEVDSILIDEARTPLIISGLAEKSNEIYTQFSGIARQLILDQDYEVDLKKQTLSVNESGEKKVESLLAIDNLYSPENSYLLSYLFASLKAKEFFHRDKEYIISNGEVLIVDEHTGRVLDGRRYSEGLHQAIEAKENVAIQDENQTLASITLQNFFRLYESLSGMTGTAMTEEAEFHQIYKLGVVVIPPNRINRRLDENDLIFGTLEYKLDAILKDVQVKHAKGQPILIGTASVESSERISKLLTRHGLKHEVLNAKNHEREAHVIAKAGTLGAITVATNMAGRGTDIILGGNPEIMAEEALAKEKEKLENDEYLKALNNWVADYNKNKDERIKAVLDAGGLYVLGTERHESRRIDNQLRGRAGRQGDPGLTRFYLSLEDDMMKRFAGGSIGGILGNVINSADEPIELKMISNAIKRAQTQAESLNFEMRKDILKYDDVLNLQRKLIYSKRDEILAHNSVHDEILKFIAYNVTSALNEFTDLGYYENWDMVNFRHRLSMLGLQEVEQNSIQTIINQGEAEEYLLSQIEELVLTKYKEKASKYSKHSFEEVERSILLSSIDKNWRHHLYEMDYLREGINLRANAQKDPLVEYKYEAFINFESLEDTIKIEVASVALSLQLENPTPIARAPKPVLHYSDPVANLNSSSQSRNSLCNCGSGKKYKRCHGVA